MFAGEGIVVVVVITEIGTVSNVGRERGGSEQVSIGRITTNVEKAEICGMVGDEIGDGGPILVFGAVKTETHSRSLKDDKMLKLTILVKSADGITAFVSF